MYLNTWPHDNCMQIPRRAVDDDWMCIYRPKTYSSTLTQRLNNDRLFNYHYQFIYGTRTNPISVVKIIYYNLYRHQFVYSILVILFWIFVLDHS